MTKLNADAVIIGGGAAGMMCSLVAAQRGLDVILLEPNRMLGRKVRITGKGRCNVTNNCDIKDFLDNIPGDRSADCGGIMEPISIYVRPDGEWALIHRCKKCGELKINRIAADDNEYLLLSLACKPLANPPFPLSALSSNFVKEGK